MPRSALLNTFLHFQRALSAARRTHTDPFEQLQAARERRLSRRSLLQASGALAGSLLLPSCRDPATPPSEAGYGEVVIVGAGMAGLHTAHRLRQVGVRTRVFDAQKRVGGRMYTDRKTFPNGQHCELGGELIDTGHETMHALAQELDIPLLDYTDDDQNLAALLAHLGGQTLTEGDLLADYAPIASAIDDALGALVDPEGYITYYDPNGAEGLDKQSLSAWFDSINASGPARKLLEIAYVIEYGLEPDVTNLINLLWLISTDTKRLALFGDSDERFHAKDGNDSYISRLHAALDPDQLELESRLLALKETSAGRYQLTFEQAGKTEQVSADHVLLALPFTLLRDVKLDVELPKVKRNAIDELGYGNNTKLMCGFKSRPWRTSGSNGETYADLGYQATWETSRLQPGAAGILTNYTGGNQAVAATAGSETERRDEFLAQLETVFPGVSAESNGKVARFSWPTHEFTRGSYSAYKVGQYTTLAGAEIERVKNLHFCGEHTSLDAQGYMEGAALTGAMAAAEIAEDLGVKLEARATSAAALAIAQRANVARQVHAQARRRSRRR